MGNKMRDMREIEGFSEDSQSATEHTGRSYNHPNQPLTYAVMSGFAADIKFTFSVAITDLKASLLVLQEKMATVEATVKDRDKAIQRLEKVAVTHIS